VLEPSRISVAFQAIVDIHSGQCAGYEILARPVGAADDTADYFACVSDLDELVEVEIAVRRLAAEKAAHLPDMPDRLLFINIDNRLVHRSHRVVEAGLHYLSPFARQLVNEIAGEAKDPALAKAWFEELRHHRAMVALDRYGETPFSTNFLLHCDIDFLKLPRSYIEGVDRSARQRVVIAQVVTTAHTLGMQVIAVGVETAEELQICRELGCDMAQGRFIQPPVEDPAGAGIAFPHVANQASDQRRHRLVDNKWILEQLDESDPLLVDTPMTEVFAMVARDAKRTLLPVVDGNGHPLGVVREQALRNHVYSAYGKELIANRSLGFSLRSFLERSPVAPLTTPLDRLLGLYSTAENAEGIIITENSRFRGFLSARSIIRAMHEKTLARARDENPLTKLPGNVLINEYVAEALHCKRSVIIVYLDFDYFKPFNDTYGFRQGDRAILLFAELLRKLVPPEHSFIGHIGGDDFFLGLTQMRIQDAESLVAGLITKFSSDAESFYDAETRQRGTMRAIDRDGFEREFPLLTISAVLLVLDEDCEGCSPDDVSQALAQYKKIAKSAKSRRVVAKLQGNKAELSDLALG